MLVVDDGSGAARAAPWDCREARRNDPDPTRICCATFWAPAFWRSAAATIVSTISIVCTSIQPSGSPAVAHRKAGAICACNPPCGTGRSVVTDAPSNVVVIFFAAMARSENGQIVSSFRGILAVVYRERPRYQYASSTVYATSASFESSSS